MYVANSKRHRIEVFAREARDNKNTHGRCVRVIARGGHGRRDGQLNTPHGVCAPDDGSGELFVTEAVGNRVHVFTVDGRFVRT